jgi:transposase
MYKTKKILKIEDRINDNLEDYLRRKYLGNYKSTTEIAEEIGVSPATIGNWLKGYDIPIRNNSESQLPKGVNKPSKEDLEEKYVNQGKSTYEIAEEIGVSYVTIGSWLKEYNITKNKLKLEELALEYIR